MITVELVPAYMFDCPECGQEGWQRSISRFLDPSDPDEAAVIRASHGLEENAEIPPGYYCRAKTMPKTVVCKECGSQFEAIDIEPDSADEACDGGEEAGDGDPG